MSLALIGQRRVQTQGKKQCQGKTGYIRETRLEFRAGQLWRNLLGLKNKTARVWTGAHLHYSSVLAAAGRSGTDGQKELETLGLALTASTRPWQAPDCLRPEMCQECIA